MSGDPANENLSQPGKRTKKFYRQIGAIGGNIIKERYGIVYYATIGRKGGVRTKTLLGRAHYQQMGRRGGGARSRTDERRVVEVLLLEDLNLRQGDLVMLFHERYAGACRSSRECSM